MEAILLDKESNGYTSEWYKNVSPKLPINKDFKIIIDLKGFSRGMMNNVSYFVNHASKLDENYHWKELHFLNVQSYLFDNVCQNFVSFLNRKDADSINFNLVRNVILTSDLFEINNSSIKIYKTENNEETLQKLYKFLLEEDFRYQKNYLLNIFHEKAVNLSDEEKKMLTSLKVLKLGAWDLKNEKEIYEDDYYLIVSGVCYDLHKVVDFIKRYMPHCKMLSITDSMITIGEIDYLIKLLKKDILFIDLTTCSLNIRRSMSEEIKTSLKYQNKLHYLPKFICHKEIQYYKPDSIPQDIIDAHKIYFALEEYLIL